MITTTPSARSLIAVPAAIALAVTLARLALDLSEAPAWLANSALGGIGAILGITWLPLLFGPWFARKLRPHFPDPKRLRSQLI